MGTAPFQMMDVARGLVHRPHLGDRYQVPAHVGTLTLAQPFILIPPRTSDEVTRGEEGLSSDFILLGALADALERGTSQHGDSMSARRCSVSFMRSKHTRHIV